MHSPATWHCGTDAGERTKLWTIDNQHTHTHTDTLIDTSQLSKFSFHPKAQKVISLVRLWNVTHTRFFSPSHDKSEWVSEWEKERRVIESQSETDDCDLTLTCPRWIDQQQQQQKTETDATSSSFRQHLCSTNGRLSVTMRSMITIGSGAERGFVKKWSTTTTSIVWHSILMAERVFLILPLSSFSFLHQKTTGIERMEIFQLNSSTMKYSDD